MTACATPCTSGWDLHLAIVEEIARVSMVQVGGHVLSCPAVVPRLSCSVLVASPCSAKERPSLACLSLASCWRESFSIIGDDAEGPRYKYSSIWGGVTRDAEAR